MLGLVKGVVERNTLRVIDAALGSSFAQAVVASALRGPLVDAIARECVRSRVVERAIEPFAAGDSIERVLVAAEPIATAPELDRFVTAALDAPAARQLVAHVIESGVVEEAVTRLLASEQLWLLIDEIAGSEAVTDAISHQGAGLVDQVADVVRDRSKSADARLERAARRLVRRPATPAATTE